METRATYKQKLAEQLKEWNARIVLLEAAVDKAGPEMKIRLAKELHELRTMQRAAAKNDGVRISQRRCIRAFHPVR